jgi:hypothetical protein
MAPLLIALILGCFASLAITELLVARERRKIREEFLDELARGEREEAEEEEQQRGRGGVKESQ